MREREVGDEWRDIEKEGGEEGGIFKEKGREREKEGPWYIGNEKFKPKSL